MTDDDARVPRTECTGPLHVDPFAHALHLGPDHPRGRRPEQDPNHDHDVEEAGAPDRRHDDHQRHVWNDEEVVRDAHQEAVDLAAEVAGQDADGPSDHHRDERRRESDDERDARAPHEQRHDVDAAVVEPQWMAPRRAPEHRSHLVVQPVGRDPGSEDGGKNDQRQNDGADRRRGTAPDRVPENAATRADRCGLRHCARLVQDDAHYVILGSSLK